MNALVEVHTLSELDRVLKLKKLRLRQINNHNLENFSVYLQTTQKLIHHREILNSKNIIVVSESGLTTKADL